MPNEFSPDHDLLIEIKVQLNQALSDIKDLKENTTKRVDALEKEKLDTVEHDKIEAADLKIKDDHERRIRGLEKQRWLFIGGATVAGFAIDALVRYFLHI